MDWWLLVCLTCYLASVQSSLVQLTGWTCPKECICLSATQVLCNGGGLTKIPEDIPLTVEHLSLTKNNIRELKTEAFSRFKHLRKLYLDGNAIVSIKQFAFRGLSRLQELSLQNTPLERLSKFTFSGLYNLTNLYLGHNQIRQIEGLAFAGTSALRMLVLSNNPTVKIHKSAFSGLSDVQMIYLPAGIQELENDTFNGLSNVGHLKLQHLNLRELPTFVFRGLRNVQVLTIQESDLGTIRKDVFTNMSNVGRLILQNNKIDMIEELAITPQNRVKSLHMVGNHLLDIPPSSAIRIEGVSERIVRNNHFPCDCRLSWLLESSLLSSTTDGVRETDEFLAHNFCISPYEVHGKSMASALNDSALSQLVPCPQPADGQMDVESEYETSAVITQPPANVAVRFTCPLWLLVVIVFTH